MSILVLDNYDSFVYNLVEYLRDLGESPQVFRNDKIDLAQVAQFDKILLSPGPSLPQEAGIMPQLLKNYYKEKNILGVCLGHQAIGECFGGKLHNLPDVLHGIQSEITFLEESFIENLSNFLNINDVNLFKNIPKKIKVAHYHSWVIDEKDFPKNELKILAKDSNNHIMAIQHHTYKVFGVQFHPESVLTEYGKEMLKNWVEM